MEIDFVYVVLKTALYEFSGILAVFSSRDAAQGFADSQTLKAGKESYYDFEIEEYRLNKPKS